ncbi:MAG TPA: hypothetical protein VGF75_05980, partial [Candidatus Saccharimonadales bacterium]
MDISNLSRSRVKRNLGLALSIFCLVPVLSLTAVYAATPAGSSTTSTGVQTLTNTIITKGNTEIQRRLNTLSTLDTKIASSTKLSSGDKATLTSEVNSESSGLTGTKTTLDDCTTLSCAETAASSIFSEYRVYAL